MGWSISPNTGLASIDSNSGVLTFSKHTSNQTYTISYTDGGSCNATKTITIFACSEQCTCSTTGGLTVPATASETEVQVGTYSSSNCGGSWSTPTLRSGTDFLKDFRFADGKIYAKVKSTNTDADTRDAQYDTGIDTCADYFTIYQSGTGVCDCNAANLSITGVTDIPASGGTHVKIADFKSECYPTFSYSRKEGDNFLSSFGTHYNLVNKSGYTYADVSQNTGNESRSETVNMSIGTDVCKTFTVTQKKHESTTFKIKFSIENNFWGASNFTSAGLLLNGVSSIIFLDEVSGYVGSATTRTWECEIPNEYSGKTITAYTIERSHLGVDVIGTGATVLTENAEVGVFYGIYDFEIEEEVTKGELLNYKYKITDKTYYDRIYFDFIDSEDNTITSSTKQDMDGPIGKGSGSGKFQTSDMTTGRGYVKPYADRYKVYSNIKDPAPPATFDIDITFVNGDSMHRVCVEEFSMIFGGDKTIVSTEVGECTDHGGQLDFGTISFRNDGNVFDGDYIYQVKGRLRISDQSEEIEADLTIDNSTLHNGERYTITYRPY